MAKTGRLTGASDAAGHVRAVEQRAVDIELTGAESDLVVGGFIRARVPLIFWQHPRIVTVPNSPTEADWWPIPWNTRRSQVGDWGPLAPVSPLPSTVIAVGSNGAVLPQATINVDSAATLDASGFVVITGPPGASRDAVVRYTGKTATTVTGCTGGTGTLATGQVVRQALVEFLIPDDMVTALSAEVRFQPNSTGSRGIRYRSFDNFFNFAGGTTRVAAAPVTEPAMHVQCTEQPAQLKGSTTRHRIEVWQNSGGPLDLQLSAGVLDAPRLVMAALGLVGASTVNLQD